MTNDERTSRLSASVSALLLDMAGDVTSCDSIGERQRALRAIELFAKAGQSALAALDGVQLPQGASTKDEPDVEPAAPGGFGGFLGGYTQAAENHGQRVVAEMLALGRAWVAKQTRPALGELMDAYYTARRQGDDAGAESAHAQILESYGVNLGVNLGSVEAGPKLVVDPDAVEERAQTIYESWKDQPGWVPWVSGGNSTRQDDARATARAQLALGPA